MFDPTNFNPNNRGGVGFGPRPRKNAQNNENYRIWNGGGVQFRLETMEEEESGVRSPPMWKSTSSNSNNYRDRYLNLSPTSRAQAIARGQLELMEMVKNMPESSYELSLKDIVEQRDLERDNSEEQPSFEEEDQERSILGHGQSENQRWKVIKRQESNKKGKIVRSGIIDHNRGLLINMFFPFSFGSKKLKKSNSLSKGSSSTTCAKVSPKPDSLDKKSVERDWWKKKFSVSNDSEGNGSISGSTTTGRSGSSGSSGSNGGSSGSSNRRSNSGCMPTGCWTFFHSKKSKSAK